MNTTTRRAILRDASTAGVLGILSRATAVAAGPQKIAGAAVASPISVLNRRLQVLTARRDEMDFALKAMSEGPAYYALQTASDRNLDECLRLCKRILRWPAETLEDAAIQAAAGYYRIESLGSIGVTEADLIQHEDEMLALLASLLLAIVRAADLDIRRIGQGDMDYLTARWWPNSGA